MNLTQKIDLRFRPPAFSAEELSQEEWRAVVGYEGLYEVSSLGRVRKVAGGVHLWNNDGILVGSTNPTGGRYAQVWLRKDSSKELETVHRLVAAAFIGPAPFGYHVNHIDGVKRNNRVANLEYCSPQANSAHAARIGLHPTGERNGWHTHPESYFRADGASKSAELTASEVVGIRQAILRGEKGAVIGRRFGVGRMCISQIKTGRTWGHLETLRDEVLLLTQARHANQTSKIAPLE